MSILQNAATWIASLNPPHPNYGTSSQKDIQSVHHSILDFAQIKDGAENTIGQWRGYRYWLGMTTIVPENPWIFASNDNIDWVNIGQFDDVSWFEDVDGLIGPVAEDAELVYDPAGDQIVLYWVRTDETIVPDYNGTVSPGPGVMRRTYSNAGVLSAPTCVIPWVSKVLSANSPAVVRTAADSWHLFGVVQDINYVKGSNFQRITYHFSTDGITWGTTQYLGTVADFEAAYPGFQPNHITAAANPAVPGQIDLLINAIVTPRPNQWLDGQVLVHAVVNLSDPTAISYPLAPTPVLSPNPSGWDSVGIYRSGFTLEATDNGAGTGTMTMRLWYSGIASTIPPESCRAGYSEGPIYTYSGSAITPIVIATTTTAAPTTTTTTTGTTTTAIPTTTTAALPTTTTGVPSTAPFQIKVGGRLLQFVTVSGGAFRVKTSGGIQQLALAGIGPVRIMTSGGVKCLS